jgi:hypothetical protein
LIGVTTNAVSPELALVCPDLREALITALPYREPDAWLDRSRPTRDVPVAEPASGLAIPLSEFGLLAAPASEELAVEERAIPPIPPWEFGLAAAPALEELSVEESLSRSTPVAIPAPEFALMATLASEEVHVEERPTPLAFALLAYTATSATRFAVEATAFIGIVVGLVSVVALVHS